MLLLLLLILRLYYIKQLTLSPKEKKESEASNKKDKDLLQSVSSLFLKVDWMDSGILWSSVCLSIYLPLHLFVCLCSHLSFYLSISVFIYLSDCLYVYLYVCECICLPSWTDLSIYLYICLSVCLFFLKKLVVGGWESIIYKALHQSDYIAWTKS